ncbi:MAG: hypothetical protein E7470_02120 [Ruminococcaceae bacterium]|nr:hypothetical protein [Oscillospiraceae bacterium]
MKTTIQKQFNRCVALLLALLMTISLPITAFAVPEPDQSIPVEEDTMVAIENAALSGGENYTYSPPGEGDFLIESVNGALTITNDIPSITFGERTVSIPSFDYYKIVKPNGNVRFYQADVLKDPSQTNGFTYIALHIEDETTYWLHVHYLVETEGKMYNIKAPMTAEQFSYFTANAVQLCIGADEVSERLKSSERIHTRGTFVNQNVNGVDSANISATSTYALNPITPNSYDSYTNSDGIINSYVNNYFGEYYLEDDYTITDDPIVNIIPKELCFILGEHIYVGKEYGFFIRVMLDTLVPGDYAAEIFVFDIEHTIPSLPSIQTGIVRVEPLFQFRYRAAETANFGGTVDPTLSRVVLPHINYDYADYYLKDVGIKYTVENPTALNLGDNGYDPYEDDGAFLIQSRVYTSYTRIGEASANGWNDLAQFAVGWIPVVGNIASIVSYTCDLYEGIGEGLYFDTPIKVILQNQAETDTYPTNSTDQIAAQGNLLKTMCAQIKTDTDNPILIHVGGGNVEGHFLLARKSGSAYNKIRIITSISVGVVEKNRSFSGNTYLTEWGRATGTYDVGSYRLLDDITLNGGASVTVPANTQTNVVRITPKVSGSYKIFTSSHSGDPYFCITNATKGTATVAAFDDISLPNKNAMLTINLIAGDTYYLEAYHNEMPREYTLHMGYNPTSTQTLALGRTLTVTTTSNSYKMLKFTPTTSGYYEFLTNKTSGDPQMFLFSASGVLLNSDDDSGGSYNAWFDHYLVAGTTYYIAIQGYNGAATTCTVLAAQC